MHVKKPVRIQFAFPQLTVAWVLLFFFFNFSYLNETLSLFQGLLWAKREPEKNFEGPFKEPSPPVVASRGCSLCCALQGAPN